MKLKQFQVFNYRSVNDSGPIEIRKQTALVGRNESGKTNLLMALQSLKPPYEMKELSFVKDFPRGRHPKDFSEDLKVVETLWEIDSDEQAELASIFPRAKGVTKVNINRSYKAKTNQVGFENLPALSVKSDEVGTCVKKIQQSVNGGLKGVDNPEHQKTISGGLETFVKSVPRETSDLDEWATTTQSAITALESIFSSVEFSASEVARENIELLESLAAGVTEDEASHTEARKWIVEKMPVFIYLHEYPELQGHQNIPEYIVRKQKGALTEADENFIKLYEVAGLDPEELNNLLNIDHEIRQQLINRAGAVVTNKLRELWTDRKLTIRFNLDANHFDTLVSDPASYYPVEINLNERSRGLKWFFSFYITFAADTAGGPAEDAIILLDEPGLHLHAIAQRDLLDHFVNDFNNTIIYTTHSPFMIPVDNLASIRTLNISQNEGTTVTNDPTGDDKTLFPIQAALGYDITQSLFIGKNNLIVEGVSDFWFLTAMSEHLQELSRTGIVDDIVITPAGGAPKVSYMVSLLTSQKLNVLVLLDAEQQGKRAGAQLVKSKLIRERNVLFVNEALGASNTQEADIEDLLDAGKYDAMVRKTYAKELEGKTLALNDKIPRIVKRYEDGFSQIGLEFNKMRPAKLFLRRIANKPEDVVSDNSLDLFETLFELVGERLKKHQGRNPEAFS